MTEVNTAEDCGASAETAYRRHRLIKHGLDPALADADTRRRTEADHRTY